MKFELLRPCTYCPFTTKGKGFLRRAQDIAYDLERDGHFACHQTVIQSDEEDGESYEGPDAQHCVGALIVLEKMDMPNQLMRIGARIGSYRPENLDLTDPTVFDDLDQFVEWHEGEMG